MKTPLWAIALCLSTGILIYETSAQESISGAEFDLVVLLTNESATKDLELVGPQMDKLKLELEQNKQTLWTLNRRAVGDATVMLNKHGRYSDVAKTFLTDAMANVDEERQTLRQQTLANVLLPHQVERLAQLQVWNSINGKGGLGSFLSTISVQNVLDIDQDLEGTIAKTAKKLQAEFEKELVELRKEFREKLIEELRPEQQKRVKKLLGDESQMGTPKMGF